MSMIKYHVIASTNLLILSKAHVEGDNSDSVHVYDQVSRDSKYTNLLILSEAHVEVDHSDSVHVHDQVSRDSKYQPVDSLWSPCRRG